MTFIVSTMLTACGTTGTIQSSTCPKPLVPTVAERKVMREQMPTFYVAFTNQQLDLRSCYVPPAPSKPLSANGQAIVDQVMAEYETGYIVPRSNPHTLGINTKTTWQNHYSDNYVRGSIARMSNIADSMNSRK